jgi:hypothetical protein
MGRLAAELVHHIGQPALVNKAQAGRHQGGGPSTDTVPHTQGCEYAMKTGEKLFKFLESLMLREFYGTVTMRFDASAARCASAESA